MRTVPVGVSGSNPRSPPRLLLIRTVPLEPSSSTFAPLAPNPAVFPVASFASSGLKFLSTPTSPGG